jgi:hypothetical protein
MNTCRLHEIEARDPDSERIKVVMDTPKGDRNKYECDGALGHFRLRCVLPVGMSCEFTPERRLGKPAEKLLRGAIRAFARDKDI